MTTLDGYPMAKQGKAGEALALSGVASFIGGFFATVGLVILAPLLAQGSPLVRPGRIFRALHAGLRDAWAASPAAIRPKPPSPPCWVSASP